MQTSNLARRERFRLEFHKGPQILDVWDRAAPSIQKALDRGSNYTLIDVFYGLLRSEMQLWLWDDSALVTELQINKLGKKFCLLLTLGGECMSDWLQYLPLVEDWAKDEGCEEVRLYGRKAWTRIMPDYTVDYVKMSKPLCEVAQVK